MLWHCDKISGGGYPEQRPAVRENFPPGCRSSGPGGIRTPDLFSAIEARSQLRYRPLFKSERIVSESFQAVKSRRSSSSKANARVQDGIKQVCNQVGGGKRKNRDHRDGLHKRQIPAIDRKN